MPNERVCNASYVTEARGPVTKCATLRCSTHYSIPPVSAAPSAACQRASLSFSYEDADGHGAEDLTDGGVGRRCVAAVLGVECCSFHNYHRRNNESSIKRFVSRQTACTWDDYYIKSICPSGGHGHGQRLALQNRAETRVPFTWY